MCVPMTGREPDVEEGRGETEESEDRARRDKEGKRQRRRKNA